jgi:hypothetical protein
MNEDVDIDVQSIQPADVLTAYDGRKNNCACGCAGTYFYNPAYRELAGRQRGYEVKEEEVNMKELVRVLRIIQACDKIEAFRGADGETIVYADKGRRTYTLYLATGDGGKTYMEKLAAARTTTGGDT